MMKKIRSILTWLFNFAKHHRKITFVFLITILGISFFIFKPKDPNSILTETVKTGDIVKSVSATGKIEAETDANLSFLTAGKLVYLGAKKGDKVVAGQIIATLDQATVEKNLKASLLDYSKQRNTYEQTLNNYNVQSINDAQTEAIKRILQNNQFDLDKSVNSVELQDLVRQNSVLITPISGVVTRADVDTVGVNIGIATVFTVVDPTSLSFSMEIDESDIGNVKEGQDVEVLLDSFPEKTIKLTLGKIDIVSHTTTSGGNAFSAKATLPALDNYRVGMGGNAEIIIDKKGDVLTVSSTSITSDNFVFVKTDNKFTKIKVVTGLQNDIQTEIKSGLNEGEIVAADPTSLPKEFIAK